MGIELDSVAMEKRLPSDKLVKIHTTLVDFLRKKKATLQELQSLIGLLSFACSVIVPGRAFLRRLIDLTIGLKSPHHKRRLTLEAKADIQAWLQFISHFNGSSLFLSDQWATSTSLDLYTDASNVGCGGYLHNQWFACEWPSNIQPYHITLKELFPIVIALEEWGSQLANQCIVFHSDNEAVVHIINKQSCKDAMIMKLVRRLVLQCLQWNILFKAEHIPGTLNVLADNLSRLQFDMFLLHFHFQNPIRMHIPAHRLML